MACRDVCPFYTDPNGDIDTYNSNGHCILTTCDANNINQLRCTTSGSDTITNTSKPGFGCVGGQCEVTQCASGTTGITCPPSPPAPGSAAGYYCSNSGNGDTVAPPGVCCPLGDYWDSSLAACTVAQSCSPEGSISGSQACCSVGPKYGEANWDQWQPITVY